METPSDKMKEIKDRSDELLKGLMDTPFGEAMSGMHELYLSLLAGGFTSSESLKIIAYGLFGGLNDSDNITPTD